MSHVEISKGSVDLRYDLDCESSVQQLKVLHELMQHIHLEFVSMYRDVSEKLKSATTTLPTMTDIGFFLREIETVADELRKDSKAHKELCSKILSLRLAQEQINDCDAPESIRGSFASARPTLKKRPKMPKKDTVEFNSMCDFFGLEPDLMSGGICKFDWKKTSDFLTDLAEQGKNIPFSIKTFNDFSAVYTRRASR